MAHTNLSKEMVDLVIKIKKHLRENHEISITLADPKLLNKLVDLKGVDDAVLQGMLGYLMALAGKEWSDRLHARENPPESQPSPSAEKKKLFARYRSDPPERPSTADEGPPPADEPQPEERKPVRYYRGQPIYE